LDIAIRPIIDTYGRDNLNIGAIIPCGTKQRDVWGDAFCEHLGHLVDDFVAEEYPSGTFGAVLYYLNHIGVAIKNPTFVVLADTVADITDTAILNMVQQFDNWMTVTPKKWKGGDIANMYGTAIRNIQKLTGAIGFSPAGMFYFKDTVKLYGVLQHLYRFGLASINAIDVINSYCNLGEYVAGCFVPRIIDCGTPHQLVEAVLFGKETKGNFYY
jgi:hypothetical protein